MPRRHKNYHDGANRMQQNQNIPKSGATVQKVRQFCAVILLGFTALFLTNTPSLAGPVETEIESTVNGLSSQGTPEIGTVPIVGADFLKQFYALRSYEPVWTDPAAQEDLLNQIDSALREGFRPRDFHATDLVNLQIDAASGDPLAIARYDVVATEAAALVLHHKYYGKVDPSTLNSEWNFLRPFQQGNPAQLLNQYLTVATLGAMVDDLDIYHPSYLALQQGLAQYRAIAEQGGWPTVPDAVVLKPGMQDPSIPILRQRLSITGDLAQGDLTSDMYDPELEVAVQHFQKRHGLDPDGAIGPRTFTALNRPVEYRIDQLRVTLERARWLLRDTGSDFVFVNIGSAETILVKDGKIAWRTRSIVGQVYRKTPVFRDEIEYMEFNPTWTVPVSIFQRDKLEKIRQDPGYLERGGYDVVNADGQIIDPASVNWASDNPAVTLVQRPGPKNALGQVKFMFPNEYSVYLHDTDNRSLFDRADRNLSSGCIRVENPFELADLLMEGDPNWSDARREEILASGKTTRVTLPKPMPVMLTYYTAWVNAEGLVEFREDIYERDQPVLDALNKDFFG